MSGFITLFSRRYPLIYSLFTTRLKFSLVVLAIIFVATAYSQYAAVIATSEDLFTRAGPIIGGDFLVFYWAATTAGGPHMVAIYQMANLSAMLREAYPGHGDMLLGWQYPPTMALLVKPLSAFPYLVSFTLWVASFGALFAATIRKLWRDNTAMLFAAGSPAVFYSIITGQTGLLTASLLALSAFYADRRPAIAGVAAGILTVKPQLGLLVPIAYAAAGRWRAFGVAALTALSLVAASIIAFGLEPWRAFFQAVTTHGDRMGAETFPAFKLITPFGAATLLGAPSTLALAAQGVASIALASYVFVVWRRVKAVELRLAALGTAAPLATPYAFYYEAALLVPPLLMIAKHAAERGWLRGERSSFMAIWTATLFMPGPEGIPSFPVSFLVVAGAFAIAARRVLPAAGIRFASARTEAAADS